jgi:FkbM family methyltransferase
VRLTFAEVSVLVLPPFKGAREEPSVTFHDEIGRIGRSLAADDFSRPRAGSDGLSAARRVLVGRAGFFRISKSMALAAARRLATPTPRFSRARSKAMLRFLLSNRNWPMTQERQSRGPMASSIALLRRLLSGLGIPASGRSPPTEHGPSEQAVSADPLWHEAHRHAHAGNHAAAEAAFRQLLAASPDHPGAGVALGQLLSHLGRHDEAIEGFIAVLERDRGNTDAWIGFTHLLSAVGRHELLLESGRTVARALRNAARPAMSAEDRMARDYRDRSRLILVDLVSELLPPTEKFVILDGGARDALANSRWLSLDRSRLVIHGFEPDTIECERLNREARDQGLNFHYYPTGLWSRDAALPFISNNTGGGSSFLPQNRAVTDRWKFENPQTATDARDIFFPVGIGDVRVTSVASWAAAAGIARIDFVKLNVQGAELEILRGCGPLLGNVAGVLAEVGFVDSYDNRPMFSDIDTWLREHGFVFFDLIAHHYVGRAASPFTARHCLGLKPHWGQQVSFWGQLVEGHALYLRDPIAAPLPVEESPDTLVRNLLKLACFAEIFGQVEYAFELLGWLKDRALAAGNAALGERLGTALRLADDRYRRFVCASRHDP